MNCDEHYIKSTLDNLIINAIQYSQKTSPFAKREGNDKGSRNNIEEGNKITLKLKKAAETVGFSIEDEGIGIPTRELHDIFGAFIVSSKTRTPAGGRGIGLALCKKVVEVHGGKIWAESNGIKGATFQFVLPS